MEDRKYKLSQYPLSWPDGWKRTPWNQRKRATFTRYGDRLTIQAGLQRVLQQLEMMSIRRDDIIISTNVPTRLDGLPRSDQRKPDDPGVAAYWRKSQNAPMQCMAIDIYDEVADNLGAVAASLSALRAIERHGGAQVQERSFRGFAALPERTGNRPWREVLDVAGNVTQESLEGQYRRLARVRHPDFGGSDEGMAELNVARAEALREIGA
jgi:hypothetical protein